MFKGAVHCLKKKGQKDHGPDEAARVFLLW